jgi:hypothetical protein
MLAKGEAKNNALAADDFDDMLAEFRAQDLQDGDKITSSSSSNNESNISSSSSSRNIIVTAASERANNASTARAGSSEEVSKEFIIAACIRGDVAQLRRWEQQGVRRQSVDLLMESAAFGANLGVLPFFVNELGTNVNAANENGFTPVHAAAQFGHLDYLRHLVKEFGADVNQASNEGFTPIFLAAQEGHLLAVSCLGKELGADVSRANNAGCTPLYMAAQKGNLSMVQYLAKELGANIHQGEKRGGTPLMAASNYKHTSIVKWLIKAGADPQVSAPWGTAANLSKKVGASAEQTAYLEAKTHCSSPECSGAGIMKCTGCKQTRYCGEPCQLAHWKTHKADCK